MLVSKWKKRVVACAGLVLGVSVVGAVPAQGARVTDDESMYHLVEKYEIVPGYMTAFGSMKPYKTSVNPDLLAWCFDLGAGVGPDPVAPVPVGDGRGPVFNWLFAAAAASSDPAVHARVALLVHEAFDPKGWEMITAAAGRDAKLAARIDEARALYREAEAQAGPYRGPEVKVSADNLGPLDENGRGTVTVTVGAPVSAAGTPLDQVDLEVSLPNGGKFESTGTGQATVKSGATLKAVEVPPGQVNVSVRSSTQLPGLELHAYYQSEGPRRSQNLMGGGASASVSGRGADFLKYGQKLDSQVIFQGGFTFRDSITRSGAISDTTAEVTADVYVTTQASSEAGVPEAPADAVLVTSQIIPAVADRKTSEAFDAAAVQAAVQQMQEATGKPVTAYVVLSTPETDENRAFTSNHLIASESISFPVITKEKESVTEVVQQEREVVRVEAGTPVPARTTHDAGLFGAGAGVLTLLVAVTAPAVAHRVKA